MICFAWAFTDCLSRHGGASLVHARVSLPSDRTRVYWHAWVEDGDRVYDWQMTNDGEAKVKFYQTYQPSTLHKFNDPSGMKDLFYKYGHAGPWDDGQAETE